jgi:predicted transcriptional regulator
MFNVKVGPTFSDARKAYAKDLEQWEGIISKTADLFMRINTRQAEIIATILFAVHLVRQAGIQKPTELNVFEEVMKWKIKRKPPLDKKEVALAIRNLAALGWLNVNSSKELPLPEEEFSGV